MFYKRLRINKLPIEQVFWLTALMTLAVVPISSNDHFTICPLAMSGFDWCPGCGLGRAIALALHGDFQASWQMHPLGFFAIVVLTFRIIELTPKKNHIWQRSSKFFRK